MVMDADVPVVESGGKADFAYGNSPSTLYPPVKVDRVLHDGDKVMLGGSTLVAHLTPGHTKGCTTWTMKVTDGGKTYDVLILGSPNVNPGYKLVDNKAYPQIAEDYERMWRVLKSLPCDIFLGAHGEYFWYGGKIREDEAERAESVYRSRGLQEIYSRKGSRLRRRASKAKSSRGQISLSLSIS
jgi:metallo-beta-lactamase class B